MNKQKIKAMLVERGISQKSIALKLQVEGSTVCAVLNGQRESKRVKQAVARELGVKTEILWPGKTERR